MSKSTTYTVSIDRDKAGTRLDRVLAAALPTLSRNRIKILMENGHVLRGDGHPVTDPAARARFGDVMVLELPPPLPAKPAPQNIPLDIVYEDRHLIVIDKPAGLVVHPSAGHRDGTLVNALLYHCHGQLSGIGGLTRPGIVHRLDKDTTGLLVVSKDDISHWGLAEQFAQHDIERAYKALVWGVPVPHSSTVSGNIGRSPRNRKKMAVVRSGGKAAITHYRVLDEFGKLAALVQCRLETGRTHQIRVHLSSIGHSVMGDPLYGGGIQRCPASVSSDFRKKLQIIKGQLLHAYLLSFMHPVTRQTLSFESNNMHEINIISGILEKE